MNATNKILHSNKLQVEGMCRVTGKILGILWPLNDAVKSQIVLNNSEKQKVTGLVGPSTKAKTEKT